MSDVTLPAEIENAAAVTDVFGYWPTFHDAEVHYITLGREGADRPYLEARIHVFEMTSDVDDAGFYVRRHHRMVTLRFGNIADEQVCWFNQQNALMGIAISTAREAPKEDDRRRWHVHFAGSFGCDVDLLCDRIAVTSVEPFLPDESR